MYIPFACTPYSMEISHVVISLHCIIHELPSTAPLRLNYYCSIELAPCLLYVSKQCFTHLKVISHKFVSTILESFDIHFNENLLKLFK